MSEFRPARDARATITTVRAACATAVLTEPSSMPALTLTRPGTTTWWPHQTATVELPTKSLDVRARFPEGDERHRLSQKIVEYFPIYRDYQQKTDRLIPVVVLERLG